MKTLKISMMMEVEDDGVEVLKRVLEHHVEELLDLEEWSEIKSVYNVKVENTL